MITPKSFTKEYVSLYGRNEYITKYVQNDIMQSFFLNNVIVYNYNLDNDLLEMFEGNLEE